LVKYGVPLKDTADISISQTKTIQKRSVSTGKTISNKYKIIEEIGRGGMGVVFKAEDTRLDRTVALKFLSSELTQDDEAKQRFVQEAKAAAALNHPNISIIHEIDEHQGQTFISMEYIQGHSLKQKLEEGPLKIDEAKDMALQVAEGLKEAHDKGIVHRDIKPANIMLTEKGQVKITDFGLAKLSGGADLTKASTILGTVAYMSPEQAKGEEVDHRTDIWSLGAMFYEMFTGERPFQKDHEQALIFSILNDTPTSASTFRSEIPNNYERIIEKALEKALSKRFQTVDEFIKALKSHPSITSTRGEKSIAVLPFTNMSADQEQEYFCDGMTEEIINALTHINDLKVIARTSSFMFKGRQEDMREIGRKLDVEHLLEGSVRKAGNRLRIIAQLIKASDGSHIWSEKYDRTMEDIFDIQDEISLAIVDNLKLKLIRREKEALVKRYTEDVETYNLYLKGYHLWQKYILKGYEVAFEWYQKALQRDPAYALAYVGIASAYVWGTYYGGNEPPHKGYAQAREYLQKALEIDKDLGEAHALLGYIHTLYDWNWIEAENEFKQALKLNPNNALSHLMYADLLAVTQRHDEAIIEANRAQELDPLSSLINSKKGCILTYAEYYDQAIEEFRNALEIDPDYPLTHFLLGHCYFEKSMYDEAIEEVETAVWLFGKTPWDTTLLGLLYYQIGKKDKAESLFESLKERSQDEYVPSICFIFIHLIRGEKGKALKWLERSCEDHDSLLSWLRNWPQDFARIPDDPEFQAVLKKYGLR